MHCIFVKRKGKHNQCLSNNSRYVFYPILISLLFIFFMFSTVILNKNICKRKTEMRNGNKMSNCIEDVYGMCWMLMW